VGLCQLKFQHSTFAFIGIIVVLVTVNQRQKMKKCILVVLILLASIIQSCSNGDSGKIIELIPVATDKKFGYIDREGKIVINPQFLQAYPFSYGRALIEIEGDKTAYGFIDETGKIVINAQFKAATSFSEGIAWTVKESGAPEAIDVDGKPLFKVINAERVFNFSEGMACFSIQDKEGRMTFGYLDKEGKTVIQPQFYGAGNFKEKMALVQNKEGQWGYINKDGKIEINYQFDEAYDFANGVAAVKSGENYGVIGLDGKYKVNPQFSGINVEPNGNLLIDQEGKAGWSDKDGKILINPQFDLAARFLNNKLAPVKSGEKYGFINEEGKYEINPQFDYATPFNNGIAIVQSNDKYGIIDKEGKFIVNPQFKEINRSALFIFSGYSANNQYVETDYFDISGLVSEIKKNVSINEIYGISNDILGRVPIQKYNVNSYEYGNYFTEPTGIVPSFFSIDIKEIANIQVGFHPDVMYSKAPEPEEQLVDPIILQITLTGKAENRSKKVYEQLKPLIAKFGEKYYDGPSYNGQLFSVKNENNTLIIYEDSNNHIYISLTKDPDYYQPNSTGFVTLSNKK